MSTSERSFIDIEGVSRRFGELLALDDVDLAIGEGEWVAVTGPSGSGKTTLLNLLSGLDRPSGGRLWVAGEDVGRMSNRRLARYRQRRVGLVFQQFHLMPYLTAVENVMLAQYVHSLADRGEAERALAAVGMEDRLHHLPSQLSGGEQQRVCIARALINQPPLIVADEPTGNLDADNEARVLDLLAALHRGGRTVVLVTHSAAVAGRADREVRLDHGKVVACTANHRVAPTHRRRRAVISAPIAGHALHRPAGLILVLVLSAAVCRPAAAATVHAATAPASRLERRFAVMGTELRVVVEGADRGAALAASETAVRAIEAAEMRLTTWRPDGELARLNATPEGRTMALSPRLAADLAAADDCRRRTGGAFDPGIGALVEAWGLRRGGRLPSDAEIRRARDASGLRHLDLLLPATAGGQAGSPTAVRRTAGLRLDEGGFGKGAGLADAVAALAPRVASGAVRGALLDLGGQVALAGGPADGAAWTVAVVDPRRRDRELLTLAIDGGSLATSGNGERGIEVAGRRYGHLLDPATGLPAPDFGSLTVWSADPLAADCLSTGLYVLGPERALALAADDPSFEVLIVEVLPPQRQDGARGLRVRASAGLASRVRTHAAGVVVETASPAPSPASRMQSIAGELRERPSPSSRP